MSSPHRLGIAVISVLCSWTVLAGDTAAAAAAAAAWPEHKAAPGDWAADSRVLRDVPQFVLDYAPLVHLHSKEPFWPGDMSEHLLHSTPYVNVTQQEGSYTVDDLAALNKLDDDDGRWVYLESHDYIDMWRDSNIKDLPPWLIGAHNIPVGGDWNAQDPVEEDLQGPKGEDKDFDDWYDVGPISCGSRYPPPPSTNSPRPSAVKMASSPGGRSSAPAVLVVVEKENDVIDAFWFYFYSYNLGNSVFTFRFGNHVGDWEHSVVRFHNGVPKALFLSEHEGGKGYTYRAIEKIGKRPVIYSASGTHAMYPTPGVQDYVLPFRILKDQTDRGPLWDPVLNMYSYHYNTTLASGHDFSIRTSPNPHPITPYEPQDDAILTDLDISLNSEPDFQRHTLLPTLNTPDAPTSWFYYRGHWGDRFYPSHDPRQYQLGTEKAYVSGPAGPRFKALGRRTVCPSDDCIILDDISQKHWAVRLFVDYLYAVAILWLLALLVGAGLRCRSWCACGSRKSGKGKERVGRDADMEAGERTALLGGHGPRVDIVGSMSEARLH